MAQTSSVPPIDDLTYDVVTVLHAKAKALEAYDKYIRDALAEDDEELEELFIEMRKQDIELVQLLKEVLARRLDEDLGYDDDVPEDDASEAADDYGDEDDRDDRRDSDQVEPPARPEPEQPSQRTR